MSDMYSLKYTTLQKIIFDCFSHAYIEQVMYKINDKYREL